MNKFLASLPFRFSISEEAHRQVEDKILSICKSEEVLNLQYQLSDDAKDIISVPTAIMMMSVRKCKDFLDMDIDASLRDTWLDVDYNVPTINVWTRLLVCYRFLFPNIPLWTIQKAMLFCFSNIQMAEFYAPFHFAKNGECKFYMKVGGDMYGFCYSRENIVIHSKVGSWQKDKIMDESEIRKNLQQVELPIRRLLIG